MTEIKLKGRQRLRNKEIRRIEEEMSAYIDGFSFGSAVVDRGRFGDQGLILANGVPMLMIIDGSHFFTLKGVLEYGPEKGWVTVDMGAVKFLYNGADVMAPGIVAVGDDVSEGSPVWVREETHGKPLAIGTAVMNGAEMVGNKGKAIRTLHHVGDKLWEIA